MKVIRRNLQSISFLLFDIVYHFQTFDYCCNKNNRILNIFIMRTIQINYVIVTCFNVILLITSWIA